MTDDEGKWAKWYAQREDYLRPYVERLDTIGAIIDRDYGGEAPVPVLMANREWREAWNAFLTLEAES